MLNVDIDLVLLCHNIYYFVYFIQAISAAVLQKHYDAN